MIRAMFGTVLGPGPDGWERALRDDSQAVGRGPAYDDLNYYCINICINIAVATRAEVGWRPLAVDTSCTRALRRLSGAIGDASLGLVA